MRQPKSQGIIFQGIHFRHPGGSRNPLIKNVNSKGTDILDHIMFLNCDFEGSGVSGAGILSIRGEVRNLVFSHCSIQNWNILALLANRVRHFVFVGNTLSNCIGNTIHARVMGTYSVRDNVAIDSRGGGKIKGAATITLTATIDVFDPRQMLDQLLSAGAGVARTCRYDQPAIVPAYYPGAVPVNRTDPYTIWQLQCNVWNNIQITNLLDDDFDDTFIEIWEGNYNETTFRGNAALKAQYGITMFGINDFEPTPENLDKLARQNPRIRTSKYRSPDAKPGSDFSGITPTTYVEAIFGFEPRSRDTCRHS